MSVAFISQFLLAVILSASSASAADLVAAPQSAVNDLVPAPPVDTVFNWTGAYAGAEAGYGLGEADHKAGASSPTATNKMSGGLAGIYGGYNYQLSNNVVLGIDADFGWTGQSGGPDQVIIPCSCNFNQQNTAAADLKWSGSLRGRVGYAFNRYLGYVSVGATGAQVRGFYNYFNTKRTIDETKIGWTIGAGVDYAFTNNMILRVDYRYSDFGKVGEQLFLPFTTNTQTLRITSNDVRLGLSYKF